MGGVGVLGAMVPDYANKSSGFMRNAITAYSNMDKREKTKTKGGNSLLGGIASVAGMATGIYTSGLGGAIVGGLKGLANLGGSDASPSVGVAEINDASLWDMGSVGGLGSYIYGNAFSSGYDW